MKPQTGPILTKSRYLRGCACLKWWWLEVHGRPPGGPPDPEARLRIAEGRRIGELARSRYPGGILVPAGSPEQTDRRSRALLGRRLPLYEAGFLHPDGRCYAQADLLVPVGRNEWDLVEVKSAGSPSEEHLHDVAFQRFCYEAAGLRLRRCRLLHVNTQYERSGAIDPARLLAETEITAEVQERIPTVAPTVKALLEIAGSPTCPEFGQGEPFHDDPDGLHDDDAVWEAHPGSDIGMLYRGGRRRIELLEQGIFRMREIPDPASLTGAQAIQRAAHLAGTVHRDRPRLAAFLSALRYPLYFLDFETFSTAVPLLDGARPYQPIPFQFSVHVVAAPGAEPVHRSFLSLEPDDPRPPLLAALRRAIGSDGRVVAYNQGFEKRVLSDLARRFPADAGWIADMSERFVDLFAPFRTLAYYDPAQRGSASLKAVLPALTGKGYDGFAIAHGGDASLAYLRAAHGMPDGERPPSAEIDATRLALEQYCGQDTLGMVRIVERLSEEVGTGPGRRRRRS